MSDKEQFQQKIHDLDEIERPAARRRILIVEDEPGFVELLKAFLESSGFDVEAVNDGVQGIKKIMANDYAVVICDMVMPNLAGDMFYVAVERVKPHLCQRFIFMTGFQGDRKIDEFIRKIRGVILWKPFKLHSLMEAVQAVEKKNDKRP